MKILFDLITPQSRIGGAQEYVRTIFYELLSIIKQRNDKNIEIYGVIDSHEGKFAYQDLTVSSLKGKVNGIFDLASISIIEIIDSKKIDTFFIGMVQAWGNYKISSIKCHVVCVIHDLCDQEYEYDKILWYLWLSNPYVLFKKLVRKMIGLDSYSKRIDKVIKLSKNNSNVNFVTVSNYSKYSISFHTSINIDKIRVLYGPERIMIFQERIENMNLNYLIKNNIKYYLMVNSNRMTKNADKLINAFKKFSEENPECWLVTIGYPNKKFNNHIILPYLSESDLINAYKHCYAFIFASFFEGFGYPPIEAMKYNKPVLVSNVTSMPEILGEAPIWFSPIYTSDIYAALTKLNESNYKYYSNKSRLRYIEINKKQKEDLRLLINMIIS